MSKKIDKALILNKIKSMYNFQKDAEFARFLGIKPQTLSSWYSRNTFDIELLYAKCVELNAEWLLTGKGDMLKSNKEIIPIHHGRTDRNMSEQEIPLYNLVTTLGVNEIFGESNLTVPLDYIKIPNLPKCDGALYARGDSMYPLLKSGDIVLYKVVHDKRNIIWGEMYMCHIICNGDEFFFTKFVQKSEREGYAIFISQNQHHQPKEFPLDCILSMALVKATIRINSQI